MSISTEFTSSGTVETTHSVTESYSSYSMASYSSSMEEPGVANQQPTKTRLLFPETWLWTDLETTGYLNISD